MANYFEWSDRDSSHGTEYLLKYILSDPHQLSRFEIWENAKHLGHQRAGVNQTDALGLKDDNGDEELTEVLLK